jgi:hypothetical protein
MCRWPIDPFSAWVHRCDGTRRRLFLRSGFRSKWPATILTSQLSAIVIISISGRFILQYL